MSLLWPPSKAGEALQALARFSRLSPQPADIASAPDTVTHDPRLLGQWLESAALCLGVEAEPEAVYYSNAERLLESAAPALVRTGEGSLLALLDSRTIIDSDASVRRIGKAAIHDELCRELEGPLIKEMNVLLEAAGIPQRRQAKARAALMERRLASKLVGHAWRIRLDPGTNFWRQLRLAGVPLRCAALGLGYALEYGLWIVCWWILGIGAVQGRLDSGLLYAWALLLFSLIPIRGAMSWLQGHLGILVGGILKERLLCGAMRLEPDQIKTEGAGQLLGRVIESEALESLALNGGFLSLMTVIELALSGAVLAAGAGGIWHALLLAGWTALTLGLGWRYFRDASRWTDQRIRMTDDLVERMVGHRTRLAQEPLEHWHEAEDEALDQYQELSRNMDRSTAWLKAIVPGGWLALGVAGLTPAFVSGAGSPGGLAAAIGGVLLAYTAFKRLSTGLWSLMGAAIAWKQVAPLFHAAARIDRPGTSALVSMSPSSAHEMVIEGHDLTFRYRERGEPVLRRCSLTIARGDRLLLEGQSGGGKSTLGGLLTGMLCPESGLLLATGLDRHTLGAAGWRRRVSAAPQFHENHVITGPFAYNLLMGREGWLTEADFQEAEDLCKQLGLGPLLERMPSGMLQMVGESGWQLSHGERSRVFIARALLQGGDLLILDESFAALDPENLRLALDCVLQRAKTILVIAHP